MANVLLIVLLIVSIIMTGLILIQQSEGGALGIGGGGGGGGGGFMSGRSAANSVSRMTWILGTVFLICSLALSVVFNREAVKEGLIDQIEDSQQIENSQEITPGLSVDPLTTDNESGETTIPLAGTNEDAETGTNPDETTDDMPAEPVETPEDE